MSGAVAGCNRNRNRNSQNRHQTALARRHPNTGVSLRPAALPGVRAESLFEPHAYAAPTTTPGPRRTETSPKASVTHWSQSVDYARHMRHSDPGTSRSQSTRTSAPKVRADAPFSAQAGPAVHTARAHSLRGRTVRGGRGRLNQAASPTAPHRANQATPGGAPRLAPRRSHARWPHLSPSPTYSPRAYHGEP